MVEGRVQGVGYRYFAQDEAQNLELTGYAKNLYDGRVEVALEGDPEKIKIMCGRLEKGPGAAYVKKVTVNYEPASGEFKSFYVR